MVDYHQHTDSLPEGWNRVRTIGKGGQATVVHIRHEDGRDGVFRRFKRPMSELDRQRFHRELEILSQKVVHQGIVTLWDWSSAEEHPWYISELGEPFSQWWGNCKETLKDDPEAIVDRAVQVVRQIALALAECHANGIVHRDLKPLNLVMKKGVLDPWPILIDFGVAHDESAERLTATNDAVGNARFSPDIMRRRLDDVPSWLDVFDLGQILIWMLDEEAPKAHWQRPIAWNHAVYDPAIPQTKEQSIKAFTASCSYQLSGPANGQETLHLLDTLFPPEVPLHGVGFDASGIVEAKRRGEARKLLIEAALNEEVQSSAPLAERKYGQLRDTALGVLKQVSLHDPTARLAFDNAFHHQVIGAVDLVQVGVGPPNRNIQLRIKVKIVPQNETPMSNEGNRAFWRKHIAGDAICFTFALEGGVPQAGDMRYYDCRWITIRRDGAMYMHPLEGDLGTNYSDNDLGGSAEGPGTICSMQDVREYMTSVFTNPFFWEFVAAT